MNCPNCNIETVENGTDRLVCPYNCGFTVEKKTVAVMAANEDRGRDETMRAAMEIAQRVPIRW